MVLHRTELIRTISLKANTSQIADYIDMIPANFQFLKPLSKAFERVRWTKLHVFWKPAVGTTYGGLVSYGFDWDLTGDTNVDRAKMSAYTPNASHAVWMDSQSRPMVIPPQKLMSRQWYTPDAGDTVDKAPGRLMVAAQGTKEASDTVLGELWATYSITFAGTRPF